VQSVALCQKILGFSTMKHSIMCLTLALQTLGFAQDPTETPIPNETEKQHTIKLRGVVLVGKKDLVLRDSDLQNIQGLVVSEVILPGSMEELKNLLNPLYLNQPVDQEKILEIKSAIYDYYEKHGDPFILIMVPPQDISSQVLQLVVIQGKVGTISVEGNNWFSKQRIKSFLHTKSGDEIDLDSIQRDLDLVNRNPFRRVNMVYSPGTKFGTTDLALTVEDRHPLRVYAGVDNTGIETTSRQRFFTGITFGNFLWLDHLFTYQYTSSYDVKRFQGHTGQYMAPLPWGHLLSLYGGYSTVDPYMPFPAMHHHGQNGQTSLRYVLPLNTRPRSTQDLSFGFDFKTTNNTITFSELVVNFGRTVNLSQFALEYKRHREFKSARFDFDVQVFYSPGAIFPQQSNEDFESLRKDAKNHWIYGKGSIRYFQLLPQEFTMTLWLQAQGSSANLLPSEQFGIGGYATVRGYDERQLNMDNAFLSSVEFRSPLIPMIAMIRSFPMKDALQFLAFIDYGWGKNKNLFPGEPLSSYLLSVGPGIRYTLDPYLAARLDWGIKLHKKKIFSGGGSEIHFSLTMSY
jgi:hemolysin activation/secretion protein